MFVQQEVAKLAMTALEFPPMQKGASFNLDAVKAKIEEAMRAHQSNREVSPLGGRLARAARLFYRVGRPHTLARTSAAVGVA